MIRPLGKREGRHAMPIVQSRRHLLTNIAVAGATSFAGLGAAGFYGGRKSAAAKPPPEVTTIRFEKDFVPCLAPQAAEELLRAEGFTDIRRVDITEAHVRRAESARSGALGNMMAHGEVDFGRGFVPGLIMAMEADAPITILAGLHIGCFEVFGRNDIRAMADLKGRTVGAAGLEDELLLKIMAGMVGLNPAKDIRWVTSLLRGPMELFV